VAEDDLKNAQDKLRVAESRLRFAESSGNPNSVAVATRRYQAAEADLSQVQSASGGTPPARSVSPTQSPAARQVENNIANEYGIPPNFAETAQSINTFDDQLAAFLDEPDPPVQPAPSPAPPAQDPEVNEQTTNRRARAQASRVREREPETPAQDAEVNAQTASSNRERAQDARVAEREPATPTQDAEVNAQTAASNRERAQAQREQNITPTPPASDPVAVDPFSEGSDVTVTEESTIIRDPNAPIVENGRVINDSPDPLDESAILFGGSAEDGIIGDVAGGQIIVAPGPVDEPAAGENFNGTGFEPALDPDEPENFPPEPEAQINSAALERLKAQAAIKQNRDPESTGDWRVKLRLASGSSYLYKLAQQEGTTGGAGQNLGAGILTPLVATDGVIFPYTPRISTLYSAEYNVYHPTHSNYNQYWYKGSKVGEVQLDATFTAQDTQEADYMLAVIHFFKSASKMFYGQDPNRGSPPPLLFLTGLGQYQYNEHPCVISQFNYILPDDVDYIRAGAPQINGQTDTLQYNLRNKNTNGGPVWAGSTTRRLINGLSPGAEPTIPSSVVNLNSSEATYVPTKIQVSLVLLPVNNRLQISQNFNLSEYGNGNLLKGGMW
jgi:hypothetical protein